MQTRNYFHNYYNQHCHSFRSCNVDKGNSSYNNDSTIENYNNNKDVIAILTGSITDSSLMLLLLSLLSIKSFN